MDMKKTAFILVFGLCIGHSGFSFAKDDMMGSDEDGQMSGMMGSHEGGQMGGMMGGMMGSHEDGQMGGMMGGHDSGAMMKIPRIGMVMSLDLSDEQRSKINKLSDELRHKNWPTRGLIMDESAKLRDLYGAHKRDPSAIGKEYQKIFDLERQLIEAMIDTQNRIEELLTPEQRAQLKDTHHKMEPKCCCKDKMEKGSMGGMHMTMPMDDKTVAEAHQGKGKINSLDVKAGKINLTHAPIPSLNWPGMTMDFDVRDKDSLSTLKLGQEVAFKLIEISKGKYVISEITVVK